MTAIGGYWAIAGSSGVDSRCRQILDAQKIFGPHGTNSGVFGNLAMGRNLYRLLPEDEHDRQPQCSANGRLTLVADVRLDNRAYLESELKVDARPASDAAILLQALETWGEQALDRLVGAFAFALWDAAAGSLMLARDPIGQRPLYYRRNPHGFAFATMPRGLLSLREIPADPDEECAARFLALLPEVGPGTFYRAIQRVVPGEILVVSQEGETRRRYWNPPGPRPEASLSRDCRHVEELRHAFDAAVAACLRGCQGHVGSQLSGGFDSSAVTATAARLLAPTRGRVTAFTAVPHSAVPDAAFPGRITDEGDMAARTAALYRNVENVRVQAGEAAPIESFDRDFELYERPSLNPFNMGWLDAINAAAGERNLTVLLTGQMGNLTISYPGWERVAALAKRGRFLSLARLMIGLIRSREATLGVLLSHLRMAIPVPQSWRRRRAAAGRKRLSAVQPGHLKRLLRNSVPAVRDDSAEVRLRTLTSVDPGNYNKAVLARFGIDTRDPTADRRVIELCLSLPLSAYLDGGTPRRLARDLLRQAVPADLLAERLKGVQAADWSIDMGKARSQWARAVQELANSPAARRVIDMDRLDALIAQWPTKLVDADAMFDYRLVLQRAVAVGHFLRRAELTSIVDAGKGDGGKDA